MVSVLDRLVANHLFFAKNKFAHQCLPIDCAFLQFFYSNDNS